MYLENLAGRGERLGLIREVEVRDLRNGLIGVKRVNYS